MGRLSISDALAACSAILDAVPADGVAGYVARGHRRLGACVGSGEGYVVLAVRSEVPDGDPLCGFRPHVTYQVGPSSVQHTVANRVMRDDARLLSDPVLRRMVRDHGRHRTFHDPDPRTVPELAGSLDPMLWDQGGLFDRLKAIHPVGDGFEIHLGFDRHAGEPRFDDDDEAALAALSIAVAPWARRVMFLHGYGPGLAPFTARERQTLCLLLGDRPQTSCAEELGVSEARARELIRDLYAKLGVSSRSELMARWFTGLPVADDVPVIVTHAARRPAPLRRRRTSSPVAARRPPRR